jgi:antitoxin (DNA-binding transcriptional repressor) of toxin-antitoxin stability system
MTTLTLIEAQSRLPEVIHQLTPGEEIALTEGNRVVARLIGDSRPVAQRPAPGLARGMLTIISDDDEHLKDFEEYMP